jgi:hypothetical protein
MSGLLRQRAKSFAWLLLVLMVAGLLSYGSPCAKGADDASASVGNADAAVRQAFNAALDAERAGANVSGLIVRLNEAGAVLVEAEIALGDGNSSEAASKAGQCVGIAESVRTEAEALKTSALDGAQTVFWMYLTFSVVGIAVFVSVLALVWRRFKRGQVEKMLGMKPEVASDVED